MGSRPNGCRPSDNKPWKRETITSTCTGSLHSYCIFRTYGMCISCLRQSRNLHRSDLCNKIHTVRISSSVIQKAKYFNIVIHWIMKQNWAFYTCTSLSHIYIFFSRPMCIRKDIIRNVALKWCLKAGAQRLFQRWRSISGQWRGICPP